MNKANDISLSELQFYLTAPYPCSYLEDRQACSLVADPDFILNTEAYSRLAQHGFRRSGRQTYRPHCDGCQACVPIRIPVAQFQPTRSQRRAWNRHIQLSTIVKPMEFNDEHFTLYCDYQHARHTGSSMDDHNPDSYRVFLLESNIDTLLIEFREQQQLRMISIIDVLLDGLSAVYTFFDPKPQKTSYGIFNVLWQIELARQLKLQYVYLGYWIANCRKMEYKTAYQPVEGLINGIWQPLEQNQ